MVKQVPYFEDSKGNAHRTSYEAWKAELVIWLIATTAVNEASAKGLADHITAGGNKRAEELQRIIGELRESMPNVAARFDDVGEQ